MRCIFLLNCVNCSSKQQYELQYALFILNDIYMAKVTNLHFVLKHTKYYTCELTVTVTLRSRSPQCLRRIEGGRLASTAHDEVERSRKMQ